MRFVIVTIMAGLMIGGILQLAKWFHPELPLWVVAFMLACIANNLANTRERLGL